MTKKYLDYEYDYKYNVTHNNGYYLPPISVCTDKNIFYDRNLMKTYFDLSKQYDKYSARFRPKVVTDLKECVKNITYIDIGNHLYVNLHPVNIMLNHSKWRSFGTKPCLTLCHRETIK